MSLSEQQTQFFDFLVNGVGDANLIGPAGTGKTYVLAHWCNSLSDQQKKKVLFLAPTHRACEVLRKSIKDDTIDVKTTDSFLGLQESIHPETLEVSFRPRGEWCLYDRSGKQLTRSVDKQKECWRYMESAGVDTMLTAYDFIIQDEASMLADTANRGKRLIKMCRDRSIRLVLCGDPFQLPPVKQEMIFPYSRYESFFLEDQKRAQYNDISAFFETCRDSVRNEMRVKLVDTKNIRVISDITLDADTPLILAHTNRRVDMYNMMMRRARFGKQKAFEENFLPGEKLITTTKIGTFTNGTELAVTRVVKDTNENGWKLVKLYAKKGCEEHEIVILDETDEETMQKHRETIQALKKRAKQTRDVKNKKALSRQVYDLMKLLPDVVKYCYSMTVYKSQGSTYDRVIVDYDDILSYGRDASSRLFYVACTRASEELIVKHYNSCK